MVLPAGSGPYSVGVMEVDVPCVSTKAGIVPVVIYYPCEADSGKEDMVWMPAETAKGLGESQLADVFGESLGAFLMGVFAPLATGRCKVRALRMGKPFLPENGRAQWPTAVFSHGLTAWRHVNSSFCVEVASFGAVVLAVEHCDGSAASATASETLEEEVVDQGGWSFRNKKTQQKKKKKTLAKFVSWDRNKKPELEKLEGDAMKAGRDWRHRQVDQRVNELHAALDGANAAIDRIFFASAPKANYCRVDGDVAVLGQSFGGATAASCFQEDSPRSKRFSRAMLYDPWIEGKGQDIAPMRPEVFHRTTDSLQRLDIWRNGKATLWNLSKDNTETLAANSCQNSFFHDEMDCGHFAQTDVEVVFKSGPLAFFYTALKSSGKHEPDALEVLNRTRKQTIDALDGWF